MLERKHCDTGLESAEREGCRVETRHGVEGPWLHSHWTLRIVAGIRLRQERAKGSWESSLGQLDDMVFPKIEVPQNGWFIYAV